MDALLTQMMLGLNNGAFYAILSLGLAIIFGMLNIINFTHGALYMMGAVVSLVLAEKLGVNYWFSLILSPVLVGALGVLLEKTLLNKLYKVDHLYGLLLTFGLVLIIQGLFTNWFMDTGRTISGVPYPAKPESLAGVVNLGFMVFPAYRLWAILLSLAVCFAAWYVIEKTKLGAYLRAGTEKPDIVRSFGINVPLMITLTYGFGVALAALAGVLAAPIFQVGPVMGSEIIVVVFAVVVIGGMGSIMGSVVTGLVLGMVEGACKYFYAPASGTVIFFLMVIVLLVKPAGLFGKD